MSDTLPDFAELEALNRSARGDQRAFKLIFDAYQPRVYTFALRYLKSGHLAEEAVQEVFVKLWRKGTALAEIKDLQQYIFMATRNHAMDFLRRRKVTKNIHVPMRNGHEHANTDTKDTILPHVTINPPEERKAK